MQLTYCQSANGAPDADTDCAAVCTRSTNRAWDAYRSDCSGLVSFAYGLPAPGRVTSQFAPYDNDISFQLQSALDLVTGDVINSTPAEHM